jgi:hypothetical protein
MALASTPIFGLKYIPLGYPARDTRAALEENAFTIEAALAAGPAAPPTAVDLATLSGHVNTVEAALDGRLDVLEARCTYQTIPANSAAVTAETIVATVTRSTVAGRRYRLSAHVGLLGTVAGDRHFLQFRRGTTLAGAVVGSGNYVNPAVSVAYSPPDLNVSDVATATSSSWILTVQRFGTGTVRTEVASPGPAYIETERRD